VDRANETDSGDRRTQPFRHLVPNIRPSIGADQASLFAIAIRDANSRRF
jgi:hypothetical protein